MWNEINSIMARAASQSAERLAHFLPGVLVLAILLLAAGIFAIVLRAVLLRLLHGLDFDRRMAQIGFSVLTDWTPTVSPSLLVARVAQWTILLLGVLMGLSALDATIPTALALAVFSYLPNVLGAIVIAILGDLCARVVARTVLIHAVNAQIRSARLLGTGVKWLVLILTGAMVLERLGIGGRILVLAFGLLFGGIVLAAALAVGLGSQEAVRKSWENRARTSGREPDTLDHV
jgi:Mechanosensitive ion channel, conserved TM helix